jgi:hypothetical protein
MNARNAQRWAENLVSTRAPVFLAAVVAMLVFVTPVPAGDYTDSAHGDSTYGVDRTSAELAGYATGNCAHCHEMHASIEGSEPTPTCGSPTRFTVFADNFDTATTTSPYIQADNFCFFCHNSSGTAQQVDNDDYCGAFGCATTGGPTSIFAAFNLRSYHNLYDIWSLSRSQFSSWFTDDINPCDACHNPHIAKRNHSDADNPLLTAISKPTDHLTLWGDSAGSTERMSQYSSYIAPYCSGTSNREPDGSGAGDGSDMPDYVGYCGECHNTTLTVSSTTLGRNLYSIDWSSSGDKHGDRARTVGIDVVEPYNTEKASISNFLLSCMDCHEAHGSENIMLLRRRVNGASIGGTITTYLTPDWGYICSNCHDDDWRGVHHNNAGGYPDAPYQGITGGTSECDKCHPASGSKALDCAQCHFHGSTDAWAHDDYETGRVTF